jgi:hypothetical protein
MACPSVGIAWWFHAQAGPCPSRHVNPPKGLRKVTKDDAVCTAAT